MPILELLWIEEGLKSGATDVFLGGWSFWMFFWVAFDVYVVGFLNLLGCWIAGITGIAGSWLLILLDFPYGPGACTNV